MPVDPDIAALVDTLVLGSPVARSLGAELEALEPERVVLRLPFAERNVTVGTVIHGGVVAALIDMAGPAASASGLEATPGGGATASLTVCYLAPADGIDLRAEARVIQRSARQTVSEIGVTGPDGTPIARTLSTNRIFA